MAYETVKDVLDRVRAFHKQVSNYYHQLSEFSEQERVKMLLDYLSRHERQLEKCIDDYKHDAPKDILDSWFKHTPASTYEQCFEDTEIRHDMSIDDVIAIAMRLDDCLINVFKRIVDSREPAKIKDLFSCLLKSEETEKKKMVMNALEMREM